MSELNIPESWAAVKFGDVFEVRRGASPRPVGDPKYFGNGNVGWLRIADVTREGKIINNTVDTLTDEGVKKSVYINPGEIILSNSGTVGLPCFAGIPLCVHDGFLVFPNAPKEVFSEYLYWFFLSFRSEISKQAKVGTQANLNTEIMRGVDFCLPPYKEQERIVQKIESCFNKIEETEQNLNKVEILLEKYRESLLAKAFRGELIAQNPDDEPASVLLAEIREERAQNQKRKSIEQEFAPISDNEKPFDIPDSWEWVCFYQVAEFLNGDRGKNYPNRDEYVKDGIPWINTGHILPDGSLDMTKMHYISEKKFNSLNGGKIERNDLVYCLRGATIGKTAFVRQFEKGAIASSLMIIRLKAKILNDYIYYFLISYYGKSQIKKYDNGSAQPNLSADSVGKYLIPIPPYEEQVRIVERIVSDNMNLAVTSSALFKKKQLVILLHESILNKAFEGRLVEQIESEGTGHELLQKILEQKDQVISVKENAKKKIAKKGSKKKTTKK